MRASWAPLANRLLRVGLGGGTPAGSRELSGAVSVPVDPAGYPARLVSDTPKRNSHRLAFLHGRPIDEACGEEKPFVFT